MSEQMADRRRKSGPGLRGQKRAVRAYAFPLGGVEQVAALCGVTTRTIQALVAKQILPAPERPGEYDLVACVRAYWSYYYGQSSDASSETQQEAKRRFAIAHADIEELEAAARAADLMPTADARFVLESTLTTLQSEVDGNAGRLAPRVVGVDVATARRVLLDEYRAAFDRASAKIAQLRRPVSDAGDAGGDADGTSTADLSGSLG